MRLIDADALIAEYDRVHVGTPGGARKLMVDAPEVKPEQKWIPCSERLPERGVSVLISHVGYVYEDYLDIDDDGALFFWESGLDVDEERQNIAWMPLPEPWKGR